MVSRKQHQVRDPVCKMEVESGSMDFRYMGMSFSFCSQQCQDRFKANPNLYIGRPGMPSPKQLGKSVIRKRLLKLDTPIPDDVSMQMTGSLSAMMGVLDITIKDNIVAITYDLLQVTTEQMEKEIQRSGQSLAHDWGARLKRAFIHYMEDTELDNLEHQDESHGCHR